MKYRMLSEEELQALEPELKEFLIVNGFDGQKWEQLNREQPDKAYKVVELFSDIVLEKVYKKVQVLERRDATSLTIVSVGQTVMELIHVFMKKNVSTQMAEQSTISDLFREHPNACEVYRGKKVFQLSREEEVHQLIAQKFVVVPLQIWEEAKLFVG